MRVRSVTMVGVSAALLAATPLKGAEYHSCVEVYLVCLNEASQAESWRTLKELACASTYLSCVRHAVAGS